ncbi:GNAT family N-acetyltransferase [Streptomyces odontomachi]|uniref:GNAT family N-acetyltransferase n=1 Tax=Streptomyces odontomachi TaxID=2944940 RepID=UPI00210A4686|nr:GNAT family N-acetyltransferase [Streptomyces sp. ODS25]
MSDVTHAQHGHSAHRPPVHHWRRDLVELAALFTAVAVADVVANLVGHGPEGPVLLISNAALLLITAGFHTWWARRHSHAPPRADPPAATRASHTVASHAAAGPGAPAPDATAPGAAMADSADAAARTTLWRLRTTVRDIPGSLAVLCTAMAQHGIDILSLQTHPLAEGTVDEFLLRVPAELSGADLSRTVSDVGGSDTWVERADAHDLVDTPTRMLDLAIRTALDPAELPLALRRLLGRCTIRSLPAHTGRATDAPMDGVLEGTVMHLCAPEGGMITVERPYLPFTPAEFARARALVELDAQLGPRLPDGRDVLTLPRGAAVTVRRADTADLDAAKEMHRRCSAGTLDLRYHGPVGDADRYLPHLLSPRFGRTLAAQTASGRIVALGHLMWDGDESEVALIVEDEWQGRGIGGELLGRLVSMAAEAGSANVYAVTTTSNTGVIAAMRGLGLPLDYQIEEGTLVITARLTAPATSPTPPPTTSTTSATSATSATSQDSPDRPGAPDAPGRPGSDVPDPRGDQFPQYDARY